MAAKETVFEWLRDAHSMEESIAEVLENHAQDAADNPHATPEMRQRLREHMEQTREQAKSIKLCLEANGQKTSAGKSFLGGMMGKIQGMATGASEDELVKNCLQDYGTEHFEIACYKSLIAAAEKEGMEDVAAVCQAILAEEEEMADWLSRQIPLTTEQFLDQKETEGHTEDQPRRRAAGG